MNKLKAILKLFALNYLPRSFFQLLRKRYNLNSLRRLRESEEPDFTVVKHLVLPGSTAVDIGANVGTYTAFLSRLTGPDGRVFAVEPIPETFDVLSFAVRGLPLSNVRLLQCAMSSSIGKASMVVPSYETGGWNYYQARIVSGQSGEEVFCTDIPTQTLDALFLKHAAEIVFIKIDVEGHELAVLEGGSGLLAAAKAAWLLEVSSDPDDPGSPANRIAGLFSGAGYGVYWYDGRQLRLRSPGEHSINYFFLKAEHLALLTPEIWAGQ